MAGKQSTYSVRARGFHALAKLGRLILATTKARILERLRRAPQTVGQLPSSIGVTGNGVRRCLAALERDVSRAGVQRTGARRPLLTSRLTPGAQALSCQAYVANCCMSRKRRCRRVQEVTASGAMAVLVHFWFTGGSKRRIASLDPSVHAQVAPVPSGPDQTWAAESVQADNGLHETLRKAVLDPPGGQESTACAVARYPLWPFHRARAPA